MIPCFFLFDLRNWQVQIYPVLSEEDIGVSALLDVEIGKGRWRPHHLVSLTE